MAINCESCGCVYACLHCDNDVADHLREALVEIAKAEYCCEHSWSPVGPDNPYRNTCCIETEKNRRKWCVTCVAADALGWDTDRLVKGTLTHKDLQTMDRKLAILAGYFEPERECRRMVNDCREVVRGLRDLWTREAKR